MNLAVQEIVFDMTKPFSSALFLVQIQKIHLFYSIHLTGGFGMLTCHAFAGVLAYMGIALEIPQPSKHKVVICGMEAQLQMSDQRSECVSLVQLFCFFK